MLKDINKPAFFVLVIYPIILLAIGVYYAVNFDLGWFEASLFLLGYYISNITVGVGLHRLWSHDSYKTNKYVEFVLMMLSAGTLQGPALSWASNHFKHHTFTDTDKDPHTPLKFRNRIKGFLWSHIGWMLLGEGSYKSVDKVTLVKLGKNKLLRFQLRYYWQLALFMNTVVPALVGYLIGGSLHAAFAGYLFIGLGRALQQEITFFVNSLCHFVGTQKYVKDTSHDIWWLFFLLLGENWHNFHHAFPSDYRNGARWYQLDVHKWIIFLMSKVGLAWDLKRTAPVRVNAKMSMTMDAFIKDKKQKIVQIQDKINDMIGAAQAKLAELENSSIDAKERLLSAVAEAQNNFAQLKQQMLNVENPSEKILEALMKKARTAEQNMQKILAEFDKIKAAA